MLFPIKAPHLGTIICISCILIFVAAFPGISKEIIQERQVRIKSKNPIASAYLELADALFFSKETDLSIFNYKKSIDRDPDFTLAHYKLGQAYMHLHEFELARKSFDDALKRVDELSKFDTGQIYYALAYIEYRNNNLDEAEEYIQTSLLIFPSFHFYNNLLVNIYLKGNKNLDQALPLMNTAIKNVPDQSFMKVTYYDTRAWLHFLLGNMDSAETDILKSIESLENFETITKFDRKPYSEAIKEIYYHKGLICKQKQKIECAKNAFREALKMDNQYTDAKNELEKLRIQESIQE